MVKGVANMNSVTHLQLFIHSLTKPKMLAAYRILTVGKIIQYTFILILISTAFSLGQFMRDGISGITGYEGLESYAQSLEWLIYILSIAISFIINTLILYAKISLYAFVIFLFAKSMNKKAEYRHLWRTAALAITWEVLITIIFPLFISNSTITTIISIIVTMTILFIALSKYPKLKK